jgi:hypothetical protein
LDPFAQKAEDTGDIEFGEVRWPTFDDLCAQPFFLLFFLARLEIFTPDSLLPYFAFLTERIGLG